MDFHPVPGLHVQGWAINGHFKEEFILFFFLFFLKSVFGPKLVQFAAKHSKVVFETRVNDTFAQGNPDLNKTACQRGGRAASRDRLVRSI